MGRILAVDDDANSRAAVVDCLRALGHEVAGVGTGREALDWLARAPFDLVIADVALPEMDGLELARRVARLASPVPVVLVGRTVPPELRNTPHVAFLPKPVEPDRLARVLDAQAAARRSLPRPGAAGAWQGLEFLVAVGGPVERFPPVRVLFLAHRVAANGALRVEHGGRFALVGVRGGHVVHVIGVPGLFAGASPPLPDDLLSGVGFAVAAGLPPEQAFAMAAQGLGVWLAGLVDARGGAVSFDPAWTPPPGAFPLPEPVPRMLARGLAAVRPDALLARTWQALAGATLSLRLPSDSPESRWGIDATTMRVIRLVPRVRTVDVLVREAAGADPARIPEIFRALDTLAAFGLVDVDGGRGEVRVPVLAPSLASSPAAPVSAPARPAPEGAAAPAPEREDPRARRLAEAAASMERAHPLEILALADRKGPLADADVANAFREVSRRYHPDTYYNAAPDVRALAEQCFSLVNAAHDLLRTPAGSADARRYLEARAQGVQYVSERDRLTARVAFRKGEVAYRGRDWKTADPLFQEAARLDAATWPHALYAAYCGCLARRLSTNQALTALDAIKPPEDVRAAEVLVYAGNLLKQDGRDAEALTRFRAASRRDPTNRDALREIRLYESRQGTAATAAPPRTAAGLFGGLLGRKKDG